MNADSGRMPARLTDVPGPDGDGSNLPCLLGTKASDSPSPEQSKKSGRLLAAAAQLPPLVKSKKLSRAELTIPMSPASSAASIAVYLTQG